jgi:tetratricopeptide (TPR) repeat protein
MEEAKAPAPAPEVRKPCVACRELIPVEATVCSYCHQNQIPEKAASFKKITGWAAGITVLVGLLASLFGGLQWIREHWTRHTDVRAEFAVARSQTERGEYETAVATYEDILKKDPRNQEAADEQVTAAMRWVGNFHALTHEGEKTRDIAVPKIDTILPILDAGLTRAKGKRAADILAHIGWVHWLNWHIAEREIIPAAEQGFRRALEIDPSNVYANAMLGNWLLQNDGSLQEAFSHFASAVQSGTDRPWVRTMQIGGLIYDEAPQARVELVKVVNDMRKHNESLNEGDKDRILGFNYDLSSYGTLAEALSAVPPDDSWATYQWIDDQQSTDPTEINYKQLRRDYIFANILELSGKESEALSQYKVLRAKLKHSNYWTLTGAVDNAIKRLTPK